MKIIVVVVAIVLMLAGASFSVLKWMEIGPFAPDDGTAAESAEPEGEPIFIDLEPLMVNIFQDNEVATTIQITVKLETLGDDNAKDVNQQLPKIMDALLRDLHGFLPRVLKDEDAQLDVFVLKKRLKLTADRLFPDGRIHDVLIQSVNEAH